jgi:hypothetical protein
MIISSITSSLTPKLTFLAQLRIGTLTPRDTIDFLLEIKYLKLK